MYQGKHSKEALLQKRRQERAKQKKAIVASVALVGVLTVGGTLAFITTQTDDVNNSFTPSSVSCQVNEEFNNGDTVKEKVTIQNTGNVDAYIRADIVVNWVNPNNGDILGITPESGEDKDYILYLGNDWTEHDGFYYYKEAVADQGETSELIKSCQVNKPAPVDGYVLQVDVIASAVQADGVDSKGNKAVELAWNVDFDGTGVIAATITE